MVESPHSIFQRKRAFFAIRGTLRETPPIANRRILDISNGLVSFWYKDKRAKRRQVLVCTITEFIDRWAHHIPKCHHHAVR